MLVINGGSDAFNALAYPESNVSNLKYIEHQFVQPLYHTLSDAAKDFMAGSRRVYEDAMNSEIGRMARNAIKRGKDLFRADQIWPLDSLEEIRAAKPVMQRWCMAQPDLKQLYTQNRCEGWAETYRPISPDTFGKEDYDYRRVMTGILITDEESWGWSHYLDPIVEGDRELRHDEKIDIIDHAWVEVLAAIYAGEDPSSPDGEKL